MTYPREVARESISSRNIRHVSNFSAHLKMSLNILSLCPVTMNFKSEDRALLYEESTNLVCCPLEKKIANTFKLAILWKIPVLIILSW